MARWLGALGVAASLGAPRLAFAQDAALPNPLRPDQVVAYARSHRAEITAARARAQAAAQVPKTVTALPDPMVMVSLDHLPFKLDGADVSLAVQQDFPLSGVLGARGRAAEAEARATVADARTVSLNVEYEALKAYLMLVELQRMSSIVDEQFAVAQQIEAATRARLSGAEGAAVDVVRARLDVVRLGGERRAIAAELRSAAAMLDAALGRPVDGVVPATDLAVPTNEPPALASLVNQAIARRPEVLAMRERVGRAGAEVDAMRSMYNPMAFVRLGPAYTMADGPGVMFMVGVSVPIWREKLGAGVAEANAMVGMANADVAAMRRMVEGEVGSARETVVAAKIRLQTIHGELVPLARQSVQLSLASYGGGQLPLVSVLDAVNAFRGARMEEVVAEVKLASAWARLGRAVGIVKVGA
ncbi:MAG TPA: TolC family protein [Minicystis sp.]|nr:TolC family protein [Minicystis sp.]